jgi:uncharacterized membrane protein YdjX (TVP38/TMEM64 family)
MSRAPRWQRPDPRGLPPATWASWTTRVPAAGWVGAGALVLLLAGSLWAAVSIGLPDVEAMRTWLGAGGPLRWLAVALGVAVALLTPISRTAVSVLLGAVAGFPAGLALALAGGLLGGLAGFALSRALGRETVLRLAGRRIARVDRLLGERGFLAVLGARLMPVAPFAVISYVAGLSGVRLRAYLLGTAVGLAPWSVLYVAIGASLSQ